MPTAMHREGADADGDDSHAMEVTAPVITRERSRP